MKKKMQLLILELNSKSVSIKLLMAPSPLSSQSCGDLLCTIVRRRLFDLASIQVVLSLNRHLVVASNQHHVQQLAESVHVHL